MRIVIDLDGVLCALRKPGEAYANLEPIPGAVDKLRELRALGHEVIIHTARHMKTTGGNVGAVVARQGLVTLNWLEKHGFEYDEIHFGKPWGQIYIDDNALRFNSWDEVDPMNLPQSAESRANEN